MQIITLIENTDGGFGCAAEHGLSFYVETAKHKILLDTGASDQFIANAEILGVDLTQDTASYQWVLGVPHGSLPEIKDIDISRVNCDDEEAFIQIAGQLCTVTIE